MRTSLTKIQTIENFLNGALASEERLAFEAQQLVNSDLEKEVMFQREAYDVITLYSRMQLKSELNSIHQRLANDPSKRKFWNLIQSIFKKL